MRKAKSEQRIARSFIPYPGSSISFPFVNLKHGKDTAFYPEGVLQEIDARFFAMRHGLPEDILSREFTIQGDVFQVMRIEPRNFKYPVIARCKRDGKPYKFSVEQVKNYELSMKSD